MATTLLDHQFELLPDLLAPSGEVFGIGAEVSLDDGGFLPGDDDWTNEDEPNPTRGGTAFGRDQLAGPTWGFNLHVNRSDEAGALATLSRFKSAWRALHIRNVPGAVIPLRYRLNDRYRRVYGRPRRFSGTPDNRGLSGFIPITADFQCVDAFTYDDVEKVVVLGLANGGDSQGGFTFPLTFPTTTLPPGESVAPAVVGGDAPAYPVVRFNGPLTNPSLDAGPWSLSLTRTIPDGSYIEVDLRPWALTVLLNGSTSVATALGRRQYLAEMKLEPGPYAFQLRANAIGSSGSCEVRWSDAWNSI